MVRTSTPLFKMVDLSTVTLMLAIGIAIDGSSLTLVVTGSKVPEVTFMVAVPTSLDFRAAVATPWLGVPTVYSLRSFSSNTPRLVLKVIAVVI
ncbi:hypothetical protein ES703_63642 [subsurface metagenome]